MSDGILAVPSIITTMAVVGGGMSGSLHASRRHMDLTGIGLVAVCTGVGGGAVRDVLLGNGAPVFLVQNFVMMALIGALAGFFFARFVEQLGPAIFVVDSLLIGVWVVIGAEKALAVGLSPVAAIFLGLTTAMAGGVIRDVLCREVPTALMPGQWVAGAAALAAVLFVAVDSWTDNRILAQIVAILVATGLRVTSAQFGWVTPNAVTMSDNLRHLLRHGRSKPKQPMPQP